MSASRRGHREPSTPSREGRREQPPGPRSRGGPPEGPSVGPSSAANGLTQPLPVPGRLRTRSPTGPAPRANPFPEVTDLICRLPLPTLLLSTRGCSPWRPAADMGTGRRENHTLSPGFSRADGSAPDTAGSAVLYGRLRPYLGLSPFQGVSPLQRKENSSRDCRRRLLDRLRRRTRPRRTNLLVRVREY